MRSPFATLPFELELALSPDDVFERVIQRTDDLHPRTDREAWLRAFRVGDRDYLHLRDRDTILLLPRTYLLRPHHGVRLSVQTTADGSKLRGLLVLAPRTKGMFLLWFGLIGIVALFELIGIVPALAAGVPTKTRFLEMLFPFGLLLLGVITLAVTQWLAQSTAADIEGWLIALFDRELIERNNG
jgi:hypothetical protein